LIGQPAPAFSLTTTAGIAFSNKEFAGYHATVLNFVAPNCGFCKRQVPKVEDIRRQYEPLGVRFVNVNQKMGQEFSVPDAQKVYADMGSKLELAFDTKQPGWSAISGDRLSDAGDGRQQGHHQGGNRRRQTGP